MDPRILILPLALCDEEVVDERDYMSRQVPVAVRNAVETCLAGRVVAAPLATEMNGRRVWVVHRRMWGVDRAARFAAERQYTHVVCGELDQSESGWALQATLASTDGEVVAQLRKEGDVFQLVQSLLGTLAPVLRLDPSAAMSLFVAPTDEADVYEDYMHGLDLLLALRSPGMSLEEPGSYLLPFERALDADPAFDEALTAGLSLALQSLEKAGRDLPPETTLDVLERWNARFPRDARIHAVRAEILIGAGRPRDALAVLDTGIGSTDEPHLDLIRRAGDVLTDMGRHADALDYYDRCLAERVEPKLLERTAMQNLMLGRRDAAAERLARLLRLESGRVDVAARLFALHWQREDPDAAWAAFLDVFADGAIPRLADLTSVNKALETSGRAPAPVRARLTEWYPPEQFGGLERIAFARTLRLAGAEREAAMCLRSIDEAGLSPAEWSNAARERLCLAHPGFEERFSATARDVINAPEGAEIDADVIELAGREEPYFWPARFLGGVLQGRTGRHEEAVAEFDRVLEIVPDNDVVWYSRGVQLTRLGRDDDAVASYGRAIELNPNQVDYHVNLLLAHVRLGNRARARECFDAVARLRPDHPDNVKLEESIDAL